VLTLAFDGFPPPLEALKARARAPRRARGRAAPALTRDCVVSRRVAPGRVAQAALSAHHGGAVCAENPGSRWPKATLGALRDGAAPLSRDELTTLQRLCAAHGTAAARAPPVPVPALRLTLFACRSLERVVAAPALALAAPEDASSPSTAAAAAAASTLAEFDAERLDAYWPHVARAGSREAHYRAAAAGATLVAPLPAAALAACGVSAFRAAVDAALPGRYCWFADDALHVTVRGLL
jgi:hypothetical protein